MEGTNCERNTSNAEGEGSEDGLHTVLLTRDGQSAQCKQFRRRLSSCTDIIHRVFMYYAYRCLTDLRSAYVPPYKARPDLLQLLENSRFQNGLSTAASLGEATGLQGDSGAFPTFHQCGQLHQSGQLQPTKPRLQGGAQSVHCTSVHLCTHLNTCFRYVHILSTAQLLLNVFI